MGDVVDRKVVDGVLHSHRVISSDWGLADWVQRLIGANKVCYASEYSTVDPKNRRMEMISKNMSFSNFVNMEGIIVNTVSANSGKGRAAIEWVVEKLGNECRALALSASLARLVSEYGDLKHQVAESIIAPARHSIEELQGELRLELAKLPILELAKLELPKLELTRIAELALPLPQAKPGQEENRL